jgi:hypothetical protein
MTCTSIGQCSYNIITTNVLISINQLIEDDEKNFPNNANEEPPEKGSEDDDAVSESDSEPDPPDPSTYEPLIFEPIIDHSSDESITYAQPVDLSMPDALSELEKSFADLSMQDPNQDSAEVEEPEGAYSFLQDSPSGSDRTSTSPLPHQLLDSSMLGIGEDGTPIAEAGSDISESIAAGSDESGHSQEAGRRWGASIGECLPLLEQLHIRKIVLGQSPAAPFADWLEFEFVKWMIERDISQGSREQLLKLPIVSIFLSIKMEA